MWASGIITADAVYWVQAESVWKPVQELVIEPPSSLKISPSPLPIEVAADEHNAGIADADRMGTGDPREPKEEVHSPSPAGVGARWGAWAALVSTAILLPRGLFDRSGVSFAKWILCTIAYGCLAFFVGWLYGLFRRPKQRVAARAAATTAETPRTADASGSNVTNKTPTASTDTREPKGVGGWLAFFCVTLVLLIPLNFIVSTVASFRLIGVIRPLDRAAANWMDSQMAIDTPVLFTLTIFSVVCGILLIRRVRNAVLVMKIFTLTIPLFTLLQVLLGALSGGDPADLQSEMAAARGTALIQAVGFSAIWFTYLCRSRRVRNTYGGEADVPSSEDESESVSKVPGEPSAPSVRSPLFRRVAAIVAYVVAAVCLIFILAEVFGTGTNSLRNLFGLVASDDTVAAHPDYKAAKAAEKAGDNATMLKHAKALVERHPKSGLALRCLGDALDYTGAYEEAVATLRKAIALDANDVVAWNDLAVVQEHMKRPSDADAAFQKALKLAEKEPKPWADFGDFCITQRRWQEAIYATEHAARLLEQPLFDTHHGELDEAGVWLTVGENYRRLCKPALATPALKRGTELDPNSVGAWFSLGEAFLSQENNAAALQAFLKVTKLEPRNQSAWVMVGICYVNLDDKERELDAKNRALAIENDKLDGYRKAVAANPKDANALIRIASIQKKRRMFPGAGAGDAKEEIACLEKALAIEPDDDFTLQLLGEAYEDAGRLTDAIAAYEKSVQLDPSGDQSWRLAGAYYRSGRLDDAIAAYQKSLQSNPAGGGWKRLASCYAQKGQLQDSIDAYRQAIAMKPPDDESNHFEWFDLGWAYESAGRTVEAAAAYKDADRFSPGFSAAMKVSMAETQTETRQRAVQLYPQLGVAGSPLNREFVARHNRYKAERPAFFINPEWPMQLAKECVNALGGAVR
jgi:tetratricopeptide (TPR) repeat protein